MPNVIFCDSLDHYATADFTRKWATLGSSHTVSSSAARNGTAGGLRMASNNASVTPTFGASAALYVETAFKYSYTSSGTVILLALYDASTAQVDVRITTATGELSVTRNGTQLAISSGLGLLQNTWYHIGFGVTISDTGAYEVRLNGVAIAALTGSGDTKNSTNSTANRVLVAGATNHTVDLDDFVISTDGFCGDCRVKALLPDAAGNYSEWSLPATTYGYSGGTGSRTAQITITQNATSPWINGVAQNLVDGAFAAIASTSVAVDSTKFVRFDFGVARVIQEATLYHSNAAQNFGVWKWQGSNDASAWTDIGASFTMGGTSPFVMTGLSGNVTAYRYYQLCGVSGTASGLSNPQEIEFRIDNAVNVLSGYECVDEAAMNSDTDYVSSGTAGQRNSYGFAPVGVTGSVKAVQHVTIARKDDAGSRTMLQFARVGGSNYDGSGVSVLDSYAMHRRVMVNNPATGLAWSTAAIDAAEFGTQIVS